MKYLFITLVTVGMMFWIDQTLIETKTDMDNDNEIDDMIEIVDQYNLQLSNLQTTIKESRKITDINSFIATINGYQLSMQENEENSRIKFESDRQESTGISESLLLVRTDEQKNHYQVIYTITSTEAAPDVLNLYKERTRTITNELFTENAQYFTCVEAWNDGIIDIVCLINFLNKRLNLTIIDEINEPHFHSWTGFTPDWNNKLKQQNDEKINVQIAVRERIGERTTVTIGTPILIHEY